MKEGSALRCYVWVKQMAISNLGVLSIILLANGMGVDFFRYNYLLVFFLRPKDVGAILERENRIHANRASHTDRGTRTGRPT